MKFYSGSTYTRDEIHKRLGGDRQSYLPTVRGRVVCACLRKDFNFDPTSVILVGSGPRIVRAGERLADQPGSVPVFLKQAPNHWRYEGDFRVERVSRDHGEVGTWAARAGRSDVAFLIFLARAAAAGV